MLARYLETLGQSQLLFGVENLSVEKQHAFLETLKKYGSAILNQQRALLSKENCDTLSSCKPLRHVHAPQEERLGETYIREGKVGCLILAGGLGTRLGYEGPKGAVSVSPLVGKSLFQLFSERVICASALAQRLLPFAIMTSLANHSQTLSYFEKNALFGLNPSQLSFFMQTMLPLLDEQGNWLLSEPGVLAEGPDGNGNALKCFYQQGLWHAWHKQGVELVNVIFVDNPLADPFDRAFIGFSAKEGLDIAMKVVQRNSLDEKMGLAVEKEGRLKVIEYLEYSSHSSRGFDYASSGQFCYHMDFIRRINEPSAVQLPLHLAQKMHTVISPNAQGALTAQRKPVFKCETFQFDLLDLTSKSAAILYPRWRTYAPLKNNAGEKSMQNVKEALLQFDRNIYEELTGQSAPPFAFELDPRFYYFPQTPVKKSGYITFESDNMSEQF